MTALHPDFPRIPTPRRPQLLCTPTSSCCPPPAAAPATTPTCQICQEAAAFVACSPTRRMPRHASGLAALSAANSSPFSTTENYCPQLAFNPRGSLEHKRFVYLVYRACSLPAWLVSFLNHALSCTCTISVCQNTLPFNFVSPAVATRMPDGPSEKRIEVAFLSAYPDTPVPRAALDVA